MGTHKDLDVWKRSIELVTTVYRITSEFPKEEIFGLTNQIRRASISIPSNIAEGAARNSDKVFIHFLYIALGSQQELETQLLIANNLSFLSSEQYDKVNSQVETIGKQLNG
ncbi:four helix bundle protein [Chryseobacterium sp.]|uniref:four helix bundle protein n=1 Tax=Chryseobacterium sp. TaxID=1871047 RepID=UPI0011C9B2DE|nr:four helix bundle protein [Chryseobacterium sp.]TXF77536.1 four helix bundle protein [Chryseobacterium sp.]